MAQSDGGMAGTRSAEALGKDEQRLHALVESSPNALVLTSMDGTIGLLNRQAEAMFGYAREELIGQKVEVLVPVRFRERHRAYRAEFAADPRQRPMGAGRDLFALRKDGAEIPVEIGLTPIEMPEGLLTLATITDITARKHAEEELKRTAAELARSNKDLEEFAHIVSHDLQEPLRVIRQHLRIVHHSLAGRLDAQAQESMAFAIDAAVRMEALIRDLLAYSLVDRKGRGFEETDMDGVVSLAMSNLASGIEETGASIQHDPLPKVKGDAPLLCQLVQNLLSNAIKFRTEGKAPLIQIAAHRQANAWAFSVRDNGIGIEADELERVFKFFYRLHARQEYPGTGIGLAICKKIVEYHGGRIWVDSQPKQGSVFTFTIPDRP